MIQINETEIYDFKENKHLKVWINPLLSFGDYDNSCAVERSNVRVFKEMYSNLKGKLWIEYSSVYGYEAIAFLKNPNELKESSKVRETLEALEGYPLIDEDDLSYMEVEMIEDAIRNVYLMDISDKLFKIDGDKHYDTWCSFNEDTQVDIFYDLLKSIEDTENFYPEIEAGGNVWIDTDLISTDLIIEKINEAQK